MSRYTLKPRYDWNKIPSEEIKHMVKLQEAWENKKCPEVIKKFVYELKKITNICSHIVVS